MGEGWASGGHGHKKQLFLRKGHFFLIEKYGRHMMHIIWGQNSAQHLLESIMKKFYEFECSTFWMWGKIQISSGVSGGGCL